MALSKGEKNALMERLLLGGLKAGDCVFRELPKLGASSNQMLAVRALLETPAYEITHMPTESQININGPSLKGAWIGYKRCGTDPRTSWTASDFHEALAMVEKWAHQVAEWERTPDLWAPDTEPLPEAAENSLFSEGERTEIAKLLDEIAGQVAERFPLPDEQLAAIGRVIEELKEASERIGRKDWKLMVYGAFVSLGLEHALTVPVVNELFRLTVAGIGHLFAGGPPMITA